MAAQEDLAAFEREIRALPDGGGVRPFLCEGSPFGCEVFLVGINPQSCIRLWDYWSVERGCDKRGWLEAYKRQHGVLGPTRARIEKLREALHPVRVLETNVFHHRAHCVKDLTKAQKTTAVFDFLLTRLKPRAVFVHGRAAVKHLEKLTSAVLKRGVFTSVRYGGTTLEVLASHHLSYQCSYAKVAQFGSMLRERSLPSSGQAGISLTHPPGSQAT